VSRWRDFHINVHSAHSVFARGGQGRGVHREAGDKVLVRSLLTQWLAKTLVEPFGSTSRVS
jgi:hypothetical protein